MIYPTLPHILELVVPTLVPGKRGESARLQAFGGEREG